MKNISIILVILVLGFCGYGQGLNYCQNRMPQFPGGENEMYRYINNYFKYPADAALNKISGKVLVKVLVDENGDLKDIEILQGLGYGIDKEITRIVEKMPRWVSGIQNGKKIEVLYRFPVKIYLDPELNASAKYAKKQYSKAQKLFGKANYIKALEHLNKSLSFFKDYKEALFLRGKTYLEMEDKDNACKDWEAAKANGLEEAKILIEEYCK